MATRPGCCVVRAVSCERAQGRAGPSSAARWHHARRPRKHRVREPRDRKTSKRMEGPIIIHYFDACTAAPFCRQVPANSCPRQQSRNGLRKKHRPRPASPSDQWPCAPEGPMSTQFRAVEPDSSTDRPPLRCRTRDAASRAARRDVVVQPLVRCGSRRALWMLARDVETLTETRGGRRTCTSCHERRH